MFVRPVGRKRLIFKLGKCRLVAEAQILFVKLPIFVRHHVLFNKLNVAWAIYRKRLHIRIGRYELPE